MLWGMFVGRIWWAVVLVSNDERTLSGPLHFGGAAEIARCMVGGIRVCLDFRDGIFGRSHKDKKKFWELLSSNSESQANMADGLEPLSRKHIRSDTSSLHANSLTSGGIIFFNCNGSYMHRVNRIGPQNVGTLSLWKQRKILVKSVYSCFFSLISSCVRIEIPLILL